MMVTNDRHLPYVPELIEKARELRKRMTPAEKKLWYDHLRHFKHRVLRQRPIDHYIVDFYIPALKLVIEIDGASHDVPEKYLYDQQRTRILEGYGLRILRFSNEEVVNNSDGIMRYLESIPPTPLRKGDIQNHQPTLTGDWILRRLGLVDYQAAWDLQRSLFEQRLQGNIPDTLVLCQHPHTYTVGKNGADNVSKHLLLNQEQLRSYGINVFEIDRGGDITYHGPGQVVGYPILDLNAHYRDVHRYLRDLEEAVIQTVKRWGIDGKRIDGVTGVWVDTPRGFEKLCAIGVKVTRWITMHGFALNVNTNLDYFNHIIPCGISDKGVTSMAVLTGAPVDLDDVQDEIEIAFGRVFFPSIS
jgi:lipoyl(octanoyl) transferase